MIVSCLPGGFNSAPDSQNAAALAAATRAMEGSLDTEADADIEAALRLLDRQSVPPEVAGSSSRPLTRLERLHWLLDDRWRLELALASLTAELVTLRGGTV